MNVAKRQNQIDNSMQIWLWNTKSKIEHILKRTKSYMEHHLYRDVPSIFGAVMRNKDRRL